MIEIIRIRTEFRIKFINSRNGQLMFSVNVSNVPDIHTAIDHFYARDHDEKHCALCNKKAD